MLESKSAWNRLRYWSFYLILSNHLQVIIQLHHNGCIWPHESFPSWTRRRNTTIINSWLPPWNRIATNESQVSCAQERLPERAKQGFLDVANRSRGNSKFISMTLMTRKSVRNWGVGMITLNSSFKVIFFHWPDPTISDEFDEMSTYVLPTFCILQRYVMVHTSGICLVAELHLCEWGSFVLHSNWGVHFRENLWYMKIASKLETTMCIKCTRPRSINCR